MERQCLRLWRIAHRSYMGLSRPVERRHLGARSQQRSKWLRSWTLESLSEMDVDTQRLVVREMCIGSARRGAYKNPCGSGQFQSPKQSDCDRFPESTSLSFFLVIRTKDCSRNSILSLFFGWPLSSHKPMGAIQLP